MAETRRDCAPVVFPNARHRADMNSSSSPSSSFTTTSDAAELDAACLRSDWAELYRRAAGQPAQEMLSADTVCEAVEPWLLAYALVGELCI